MVLQNISFQVLKTEEDNRHEGVEYPMNQHGFARDMDFALVSQSENEVWFALDSTEDTYKVYPFHFHLEIGYRLEDNKVVVMWKVKNTNEKKMYFSIGAHPAFFCPFYEGDKQTDYYVGFGKADGNVPEKLITTVFGQGGCVTTQKAVYVLENGILPITADTSPLVGVWSPPKKNAPFVCIEPWYGRCDSEVFDGELKDREWGNELEAGEEFYAEYKVVDM